MVTVWLWFPATEREVVGSIPSWDGHISTKVECENDFCTMLWVHIKEPQVVEIN